MSSIIDISSLSTSISFDNLQGLKVELDKTFSCDTTIVYDCLFDETGQFQVASMSKANSSVVSSSEFQPKADAAAKISRAVGDLGSSANVSSDFTSVNLIENNSVLERKRRFKQKMNTPVLNKWIHNDEVLVKKAHQLTFQHSTASSPVTTDIVEVVQELEIMGYFHIKQMTFLIPTKVRVEAGAADCKVLETKLLFRVEVKFLKNIPGKSFVAAAAKKNVLEHWLKMTVEMGQYLNVEK